jgi:hypothetical protein
MAILNCQNIAAPSMQRAVAIENNVHVQYNLVNNGCLLNYLPIVKNINVRVVEYFIYYA